MKTKISKYNLKGTSKIRHTKTPKKMKEEKIGDTSQRNQENKKN